MRPVILYARPDSIYKDLGCDVYDIQRDARKYKGKSPVIAHPPCRAWGRLKGFARPREDEKDLALHAVDIVRKNGGVLEHPVGSSLFGQILPKPGDIDSYGGWTFCVQQHDFGHKAQKKTFLYIVGILPKQIPPYPLSFDAITHYVERTPLQKKLGFKAITKKEREQTPLAFAQWLILLIKTIRKNAKQKSCFQTNNCRRIAAKPTL